MKWIDIAIELFDQSEWRNKKTGAVLSSIKR